MLAATIMRALGSIAKLRNWMLVCRDFDLTHRPKSGRKDY
jgi:hypothetical protein